MRVLLLPFVLMIFASASMTSALVAHKGVQLRDITALTLHAGQNSTGLRSPSQPQLQCLSDERRCSHAPTVIQCRNVGWDGLEVHWRCETLDNGLPEQLKLGEGSVDCEDYTNLEGYVLAGSCVYRYTLVGTPPLTGWELLFVIVVLSVILALLGLCTSSSGHSDNFWMGYIMGGGSGRSSFGGGSSHSFAGSSRR
jgi:hypothetical protein